MPGCQRRGGAGSPQGELAAIEHGARLTGGGIEQQVDGINGRQPLRALSGNTVAILIPSAPPACHAGMISSVPPPSPGAALHMMLRARRHRTAGCEKPHRAHR